MESLFISNDELSHDNVSMWQVGQPGILCSKVKSFKREKCVGNVGTTPNTLNIIDESHVLVACAKKPIINVWPLSTASDKAPSSKKSHLTCPGVITAMTVHPSGSFIYGSVQQSVYMWSTSTGDMCSVLPTQQHHFQTVRLLEVNSPGGDLLVVGSDDGKITVWCTLAIVSNVCSTATPSPLFSFSQHMSSIMSVHLTPSSSSATCRLFSLSSNGSCKCFCLSTGLTLMELGGSSVSGQLITAMTVDNAQCFVYLATKSPNNPSQSFNKSCVSLWVYSLGNGKRSRLGGGTAEENEEGGNTGQKLQIFSRNTHSQPITTLSISMDAMLLASGSEDGSVILWDTLSRQSLTTILPSQLSTTNGSSNRTPMTSRGPITNLKFHFMASSPVSRSSSKPIFMNCTSLAKNVDESKVIVNVGSHDNDSNFNFDDFMSRLYESSGLCGEERCRDEHKAVRADKSNMGKETADETIQRLLKINSKLYQLAVNNKMSCDD